MHNATQTLPQPSLLDGRKQTLFRNQRFSVNGFTNPSTPVHMTVNTTLLHSVGLNLRVLKHLPKLFIVCCIYFFLGGGGGGGGGGGRGRGSKMKPTFRNSIYLYLPCLLFVFSFLEGGGKMKPTFRNPRSTYQGLRGGRREWGLDHIPIPTKHHPRRLCCCRLCLFMVSRMEWYGNEAALDGVVWE